MKLVPLLVLALVACKSHKPAAPAPATGSATAALPAATPTPTGAPAPALPHYIAPEAPDDEVVPAQAMPHEGSAAPVVQRDPQARIHDKLDANHDGKLTPDEVKKAYGDDVDTDGDGEISKSELQEAMRVKRVRARVRDTH
jgi:hypothetical protein